MKKLFTNLKWIAVWSATWTMLATPVAMGADAQRVSKAQMQAAVDELGLNRQMTIGQFYQKNKSLLPDRIRKEIEPFFMANKNMMMPTFEVTSSKTTSGDEIPSLRVSVNGELLNIQWFGEKNRLAKFQNTNLTEVDMINFDDMFTRIVAGDEKFRKQISPVKSNLKTKYTAFRSFKYPTVSKDQWKTMSAKDRANYIVNFRSLYIDAKEVLTVKAKYKPSKKKKYSLNLMETHPYFAALFYANEAQARTYFTARSCVVAGYVSVYAKRSDGREVCSSEKIAETHASDPLYQAAQAKCGSGQIACNPNIYGAPNGQPTCLSPSDPSFQQATHFTGPCDTASRLQKSEEEVAFLKDSSISRGRYDDANLSLSNEARKERFQREQTENQELTENYLIGVLKLKGKLGADVTKLDASVLDDNMRLEIEKIRSEFETKIAAAVQTCRDVANEESTTEQNYWPACDQLHRRFLFISELYAKKCEEQNLPPTPNQLTCSCPAPSAPAASAPAPSAPAASSPAPSAPAASAPTPPPPSALPPVRVPVPSTPAPSAPAVSAPAPSAPSASAPAPSAPVVPPGASCPQPPPAVAVTTPPPAAPSNGQICDAIPSDANCTCPSGGRPTLDVSSAGNGQSSYSCGGSVGDRPGKDKNDCGFFCKMWKGVKTIAPFAIAGVAAYFIFKKLAPKKPALSPAADLCPGTNTPPPCAQTCTPPLKLQSSGACSCDGCPPGQTPDATCTCTSAPVNPTNPSTILCPDSVTRAADLNACPDYPCWNGSSYKNPMNCPAAPASTTNGVGTGN